MLTEQGFAVIYAPVAQLQLEAVAGVHALHPANTKCPQCKGTGRVPMHHGLRDKECPRCGGRGGSSRSASDDVRDNRARGLTDAENKEATNCSLFVVKHPVEHAEV